MSNSSATSSKIVGYLRVSTERQDLNNQKLEILDYAHKGNLKIDSFIEVEASSRRPEKNRKIDLLLSELKSGDLLIVSELSRIGRSVGQIIQIIDTLVKNGIRFISIKEPITVDGEQNIQTKTMITLFSLFSEIERDLISQRTKQGLMAARQKGKLLGRPKGTYGSKLDKVRPEIEALLANGSSKTFIAKRYKSSLPNFYKWLNNHKIKTNYEP